MLLSPLSYKKIQNSVTDFLQDIFPSIIFPYVYIPIKNSLHKSVQTKTRMQHIPQSFLIQLIMFCITSFNMMTQTLYKIVSVGQFIFIT